MWMRVLVELHQISCKVEILIYLIDTKTLRHVSARALKRACINPCKLSV